MNVVFIGNGPDEQAAARLLERAGYRVQLLGEAQPPPEALLHDANRSVESMRGLSARDAEAWPRFASRIARIAGFLGELYGAAPPDPLSAGFALRARRLGREGLTDLMRVLPMSVAELLDGWFESDALKGLLGARAVAGLHQGPRSGGTAFALVHANVGCAPGVFRDFPLPSQREERLVDEILVEGGKVRGVRLASGEEREAALVVSGLDPRRTLAELVDAAWLDPELVRAVRHIRFRPVRARLEFELERETSVPRLTIAPSLDYIEQAYDCIKYGELSRQPVVDVVFRGRRAQVDLQYVPESIVGDAVSRLALETLEPHLGRARLVNAILPAQFQPCAELTLDQALWMRPLPELARYRTPIEGLWLCGASMHPGPGTAGASGHNCARAILRG